MAHCRTTKLKGTLTVLILQTGPPTHPSSHVGQAQLPWWFILLIPCHPLPHPTDPDGTLPCTRWHLSGQLRVSTENDS